MRTAYTELYRRIADDGLPPGVAETVVAAIDGLWLNWVLGLVPVDQTLVARVRNALQDLLAQPQRREKSLKRISPREKRVSRGRS